MAKCKMRTEKGVRYWHPICVWGSVHGREGCTCYEQPFIDSSWIEIIDRLEQRVIALEKDNKSLSGRMKRLSGKAVNNN